MKTNFRRLLIVAVCGIALLNISVLTDAVGARVAVNGTVSEDLFRGLRWRNIGPFHGGRVSAVTGAIGQPGTFYLGAPIGGIWKTTNAGVSWFPIFDQFKNVDSIGAIQVAPSDPNIVYAGTGDSVGGPSGDGMYKSIDAGKTWTHIGLEETTKINKMVVDPKDPNIVIVSTQGDATHSGRGIYRTTDGGKTWENTLRPENANGTRDVEYAFDMPNVIFATSQGAGGGFGGGGGGGAPPGPNGTALYKSIDEGKTWAKVTMLPRYNGRISVAIAMHTGGQRVFVIGTPLQGASGLSRSDDQGATWQHMAGDETRIANGQGNFSSGVWADPQNPDIVYTIATTVYRSTDGGKTFNAFKGAPGGEDPHVAWFDPTDNQRFFFGFDQGPAITLDGGLTWSGYYQIPIAQIYHLATDNRYPYWVMGSQQDTGAIMTRSRSDQGQITQVDWYPLPSSEFGIVMPDPLKPTTVYGVGYGLGQGNGLIKIDLATGQWGNVAPNFGTDRNLYAESFDFWKRFDTAFEPKALYVGYNCILVTRDGAQTWKAFSPDLTTPKGQPMVPCGVAPAPTPTPAPGATPSPFAFRASISDFSISTVKQGVVWSGSANGQIYNTFDSGKTWTNVTNFPDLPAGTSFVTVEAGHNDVNTAYVLANIGFSRSPATGPQQHYIYRTHDAGKTWTRIVNGLPNDLRTGTQLHVIREDPKQKGLLFAGTETTVYVSFDDGDHWQSLQLNLPSTSIRDMVFHTNDHMNDLVICTYGRGFWVLDDMSPLREIAAKGEQIASAPAYLFKPGDTIRARANANWDQPMNPDMPHALNPPYGALIYYHLSKQPAGEIRLQIFDAANKLVRTITSTQPPMYSRPPYPDYWLMPSADRALSITPGTNRINWDLRYDDPPGLNPDINNQMNSSPGSVTPGPHGPLALPGTYTLKLIVDGQTSSQTLIVRNDPRIGESAAVMVMLRAQEKLAMAAVQGMKASYAANDEVAAVRAKLSALQKGGSLPPEVATAAVALDTKLATFGGIQRRGPGGGGFGGPARLPGSLLSFVGINAVFNQVLGPLAQNGIDMAPTKAQVNTLESGCNDFTATANGWKAMLEKDLVEFNGLLIKNNLTPIKLTRTTIVVPASCKFVVTGSKGIK